MGKGGCFEAAQMGFGAIRGIIGCLCCMICIGPTLFIIGIVMLSSENNYQARVDSINAAAQFAERSAMTGASGSVGGVTLSMSETTKPLAGQPSLPTDAEGIKSGLTSVILSTGSSSVSLPAAAYILAGTGGPTPPSSPSSSPSSTAAAITTTTAAPPIGTTTTTVAGTTTSSAPVPPQPTTAGGFTVNKMTGGGTKTISVRCPSRTNTRRSSGSTSSSDDCLTSELQSLCEQAAGCSSAKWKGTSRCNDGSTCSGCEYTVEQTAACIPVRKSGNSFVASTTLSSCLYPFGAADQPTKCSSSTSTSSSTSVPVTFVNQDDPFIAFEKATEGDGSLGLTAAQQRGIGVGLMAAGAICTAALVGLSVMVYRMMSGDKKNKGMLFAAFGRPYEGQMYNPQTGGWQPYNPNGVQYGQPMSPYQAAPQNMNMGSTYNNNNPYQQQSYAPQPQQQQGGSCYPAGGMQPPMSPQYGQPPPPPPPQYGQPPSPQYGQPGGYAAPQPQYAPAPIQGHASPQQMAYSAHANQQQQPWGGGYL